MSGNLPTDVAQQALDAAGVDHLLGDIEDGVRPAQVTLRAYRQCLMQLLRTAHWNFARRQSPLQLLADATGNTPNVGTIVTDPQFIYEYAWPTDGMKLRYIPWSPLQNPGAPAGNIVPPNSNLPLTSATAGPFNGQRIRPAKFVISNDPNYPTPAGAQSWEVQGVSPQGRVVILCNVPNAVAVYTYLCLYPSVWDSLFRAAFVAFLASEIALPLSTDKKLGLQMRNMQMAIAKQKIIEARVGDAREGIYTSDTPTDWLRFRNSGGAGSAYGWADGGAGGYWGGLDACCGALAVTGGAAF